jgi:hypothetical protein
MERFRIPFDVAILHRFLNVCFGYVSYNSTDTFWYFKATAIHETGGR